VTSSRVGLGLGTVSCGLHELEALRQGLRIIAARSLGDEDAAADAVQETLARAVVALADRRAADVRKVPAFVSGIVRHVIADVVRQRRRMPAVDAAAAASHPSSGPDALGRLVSAEDHARVRCALEALQAADRRILALCYFEGLAPEQIAAILGEPPSRVRKRKSRALQRLRHAYWCTRMPRLGSSGAGGWAT